MSQPHFALSIETAPTAAAITTADAKTHLRVDISEDDSYIDLLVTAATTKLEVDTGLSLITQTWNLKLDHWPTGVCEPIKMPKAPLQSVVSITYTDENGDVQTMDAADYRVDGDSFPARITPAFNVSWPTIRHITGSITIQFVCGYGAAGSSIEQDLIHALKMLIGHWYENRESVVIGTITSSVPQAYDSLIEPHKLWNF